MADDPITVYEELLSDANRIINGGMGKDEVAFLLGTAIGAYRRLVDYTHWWPIRELLVDKSKVFLVLPKDPCHDPVTCMFINGILRPIIGPGEYGEPFDAIGWLPIGGIQQARERLSEGDDNERPWSKGDRYNQGQT